MIKNVVFDFGQVLIRFEPEYMCGKYLADKSDISLVSDVLFDRIYWERLDLGTITDEELIESVKSRLPERLWAAAEDIYGNWMYNLPEIEGMRECISAAKRQGFGVYLLSNISKGFAERASDIPILSLLDGYVFSGPIGIAKPSSEIFSHLCEKFSLTPSETLFIDDNLKNIDAADKFGIIAYHFNGDSAALLDYIRTLPSAT